MQAHRLRVEHVVDPLGLDEPRPRLSWELESDRPADAQTRFHIVVASTADDAARGHGDIWDSGIVPSSSTFGIEYDGPALSSRQRCHWSVRVWDVDGQPSAWSAAAGWEMGLLEAGDWTGDWVTAPADLRAPVAQPPDGVDLGSWRGVRPTCLRERFTVDGTVASARIYVTARGLYQLHLNGERVSTDLLRPGWTDYRIRIPYQVYDVTAQLRNGSNMLGALLGSGWYCGRIAWHDRVYGEAPSLLAQLHIDYADGRSEVVATGPTWVAAPSPLLWSDLLMGEAYDGGADWRGWCDADAGGDGWSACEVVDAPAALLVAQVAPPVRVLPERPVSGIISSWIGRWIADVGQNITGYVRLRVSGAPGTVVKLRFGETLENDGSLHTANLRSALSTDVVILGEGETVWEPSFTVHGFRYVEVTGWPGDPDPDALTAVVVGTDVPPAGAFECSSPLVGQLQQNIEWSQRGNFLEVPTDCPQRDERLGWTADLQVFLPTACANADTQAFMTKWLVDLCDTVQPDGAVADVAPLIRPQLFSKAAPGWGDAITIAPWTIYKTYGDVRLLDRCFPAMAGWVGYVAAANPDRLWRAARGNDYGDWLSVDADTPKDLVATAYHALSARVTAAAASVLDRKEERDRFTELADEVRAAFIRNYVSDAGRVVGDTQTSYVLALAFDLMPEELRDAAAGHLVADIRRRGWHLSTGFLGISQLLPTLTESGHVDVAFRLLEQDSFPSWGYEIRHGATTLWERWDARTEAGFKPHEMNSFNHYAFGSVGAWLYDTAAGIRQADDSVAFERIVVQPRPGGSLRWVRAHRDTIRGRISVEWRRDADGFRLDVGIPPNTSAEVVLPDGAKSAVAGGDHHFEVAGWQR